MPDIESENQYQDDERLSVDFLNDLHDYMDKSEVHELNINTEDEKFQISNNEQAGFFIRKLMEVRSETKSVNNAADQEISRILEKVNAWREKEITRCGNAEAYLMALLQNYAAKELENSDKKSLKLPFGTLSFKKQQDKYEYNDEVLLEWLKEQAKDLVRIKEEPNKADLKKNSDVVNGKLLYKGNEVAGVTVTPQESKFEVK